MQKITSTKAGRRGIFAALVETIPYALVPLIFLINFTPTHSFVGGFQQGAVLTFGKDFTSFFLMFLFLAATGKLKGLWGLAKTRAGYLAGIAGVFGGPIGYTLYNTAFYMAGPSIGHAFAVVEPIILSIATILILKRKTNWLMWMGIGLTTIAVIALIFGESFTAKDPLQMAIGSILGILGAGAWTVESFLFDKAYTINPKADHSQMIIIKMIISVFFSIAIMIPMSGAIRGDASMGYTQFGSLFTNMKWLWRLLTAGFLIFIGRLMYFYAVKSTGSVVVVVLYNITVVLTPIFALLYWAITGDHVSEGGDPNTSLQYQLVLWLTMPFMIAGSTIVIFNFPKVDRAKEKKLLNYEDYDVHERVRNRFRGTK